MLQLLPDDNGNNLQNCLIHTLAEVDQSTSIGPHSPQHYPWIEAKQQVEHAQIDKCISNTSTMMYLTGWIKDNTHFTETLSTKLCKGVGVPIIWSGIFAYECICIVHVIMWRSVWWNHANHLPIVAEKITIPSTFMPSLVPGDVFIMTSGGGVRSREKFWMSVPLSSWIP